jgi:hypothetical protein
MRSNMKLSSRTSVRDYMKMEHDHQSAAIAKFVRQRFTERYITPMSVQPDKKNGFALMAISCLLIEALESFHNGWPDTQGKGEKAFSGFFARHKEFGLTDEDSKKFYSCVRCGILHQGETKCGWRIRRAGPLFERGSLTINATRFHAATQDALIEYCRRLEHFGWEDEIWKNLRLKMKSVCRNCERDSASTVE